MYKFYTNGQVNKVLDINNELKNDSDYANAFNKTISSNSDKKPTLFEGYYRLKDNKLVIQSVVSATRQFFLYICTCG
jgi:hypothetical protein